MALELSGVELQSKWEIGRDMQAGIAFLLYNLSFPRPHVSYV